MAVRGKVGMHSGLSAVLYWVVLFGARLLPRRGPGGGAGADAGAHVCVPPLSLVSFN